MFVDVGVEFFFEFVMVIFEGGGMSCFVCFKDFDGVVFEFVEFV